LWTRTVARYNFAAMSQGKRRLATGTAAAVLALVACWSAAVSAQGQRDIAVERMVSEKRVALVIGNAAYAPPAALRNPVNDARDMAQVLRGLGFDVIVREDATQRQMQQALREFAGRLAAGGVGLFYFAGHGVQVKGKNYLIPVGVSIDTEAEAEDEAIDVNGVLSRMAEAGSRVNIVVLDACRNNPFARGFRSATRGLASVGDAPSGTLVAYATAPGRVAADGTGRNGVYTDELLKAMREPGLTLEDVFKRVIRNVRQATREQQVPWFLSSVGGDFVFAPRPGEAAIASTPPPAVPEPRVTVVPRAAGSLVIRSPKEAVEVWLGERRLGEAGPTGDLEVDSVAVGTHHVRAAARRPGVKSWERGVLVAAGQRAEVTIDIELLGPAKVVKGDDGAEMVLVPAGEFRMGSTREEVDRTIAECRKHSSNPSEAQCRDWFERELPQHRVLLADFYIDRYETTNALFEAFVRATRHQTTAEREGNGGAWQQKDGKWQWLNVSGASWRAPYGPGASAPSDHPVVQVSWHDAEAYCKWAGKRLPTEAEWEKAARGADARRYPWGEEWAAVRANGNMTVKAPRPVGLYPGGVSPYGVHDMTGNVYEWVADWFDASYYRRSPERNPKGLDSGTMRVLRGGSWRFSPLSLRTASRHGSTPDYRTNRIGVRCARGAF
jgi:formylglycine-generating enzyme required for sulfatase activity